MRKQSWQYKLQALMLPGLKRWILVIFCGIGVIVFGVFLLLGFHPVDASGRFIREMLEHATEVLPHRISGLIAISIGIIAVSIAMIRFTRSILGAYLPDDRESIPDVLYRQRHLNRGPKVVVVGGGTGLSNLLNGLKEFTNNITAIVTVGDDGGSSGRLRQELGVLPPGDIRNCITALADEDKLVTELFRYRFQQGEGLEGHSFGNLFLTAVCSMTQGNMLEAAKVASRILNSCGQVLPSTLTSMTLVAHLQNNNIIRGESNIANATDKIIKLSCDPVSPEATPAAIEAINNADFLILGPGSLYTSIIPNLLVKGIPQAIMQSSARKIYVCNVMTQKGETINYTVSDHVLALFNHAGLGESYSKHEDFIHSVMVNVELPNIDQSLPVSPVSYDADRLKQLGIKTIARNLASKELLGHHDAKRLAAALMSWYLGKTVKSDSNISKKQNENEPLAAL
jgi:uncharacterized cofD-like protein